MKEAFVRLIENLANFIKLKTALSLMVVGTACYLALKGNLDIAVFMTLCTAIVTYYFTRKEE